MLVSFKFECMKHGEFDHYFDSVEYPDRNFPLYNVKCPEEECDRYASVIFTSNMSPDHYWSGKAIETLGLNNVTSRDYLRRFLKTEGISQLTSDEIGHHNKQKTKKEKLQEYVNKPENVRKRRDSINESLEKEGLM